MYAASWNRKIDVVKILLENAADINAQDTNVRYIILLLYNFSTI